MDLNHTRLPIPPRPHVDKIIHQHRPECKGFLPVMLFCAGRGILAFVNTSNGGANVAGNDMADKARRAVESFMRGRSGVDSLSSALVGVAAVLAVVGAILHARPLSILAMAPLACAVWRALSRNVGARAQENRLYLERTAALRKRLRLAERKVKNRKTTMYITCKRCGTTLAVPRGKGTLRVTCPKCHAQEVVRS